MQPFISIPPASNQYARANTRYSCVSLSQVELASHGDSSHDDPQQLTGVGPERTGAKKLDAYDFK